MARAHLSQIFFWILLALIGGVALRSFISIPYFAVFVGLLAGCALCAVGVSGQNRYRIICGLLAISLFVGIMRFDAVTHANPYVVLLTGKSATLRGVVWAEPIFGPQSQTLQVRIFAVGGRNAAEPFMLRAVAKKYPGYEIGDEVVLSGKISDPADNTVYRNNGPVPEPVMLFPSVEKTGSSNGRPVVHALARIKRVFEESIDAALPEPHAAFLKGLLLGERAALPADLIDSFKKTGTSHMIALSGYNITIIGRSLASMLVLLAVPFYASFWVALTAMVLFVVMTGASASAVRAGIIAILALIAHREGRPYQMTNALACAGAAMLVLNPTLLRFDVGFQLSFLATMGLVYLSPGIEKRLETVMDTVKKNLGIQKPSVALKQSDKKTTPEIFFTVKHLLIETLAAELAVLPLLVYLFGYLSIVSPLANIAALIAVPYAMGAGFFTGLAGFFSSVLGSVIGTVSWVLLEYIMDAVKFFAAFPYAAIELGRGGIFIISALYIAAALQIYRKRKKNREQSSAYAA